MIYTYVVDAFTTSNPFSGNPAGVCLLDEWKSTQWMQQIAAELKHSETAFIIQDHNSISIRYFTPTIEVPLCGHATLAAASVLWQEKLVSTDLTLTFNAQGGVLKAKYNASSIQLDFPATAFTPYTTPYPDFINTLSIHPESIYTSEHDIIFILDNEMAVINYNPYFLTMQHLPYRFIAISALSKDPDIDFVSRVFAPSAGINEDPATGIAHCVLGPLWSRRLNKTTLNALQASPRGAQFSITIDGLRVLLSGTTKTIFKGKVYV